MAASTIENWDDDGDIDFDHSHSVSSRHSNFSSKLSAKTESNAGDEDWQVLVASNDENATKNAIQSAKQAGIPIPQNTPSSALLGGTIRKLGKKKSRRNLDDDWGLDIELPGAGASPLKLKPQLQPKFHAHNTARPITPSNEADDFDVDWAEGSLGIRFGGTKRDVRNRSSSASIVSPSLGSCMTVESEDDGLDGLVLPSGPTDLGAALERVRREREDMPDAGGSPLAATSSPVPAHAAVASSPTVPEPSQPAKLLVPEQEEEEEDDLEGLDLGSQPLIDPKKHHRNIKIASNKIHVAPARSTTTLTFTDRSANSRIPRPTSKPSRLDPVLESGAVQVTRTGRPAPTTTSAQLLRSKRSAPVLRSHQPLSSKPSIPFLPAGSATQSHHVSARASQLHLRRDSNPERPQSPTARTFSRMSRLDQAPDTPSRAGHRRDMAAPSVMRENTSKRNVVRPARQRNFGDGSELDLFDDLPTSATKENQFVKLPTRAGPPRPMLKSQTSLSRLVTDRTGRQTPMPQPPSTPTTVASGMTGTTIQPQTPRGLRSFQEKTPSFARDTAASRAARESRLGGTSSRLRDGPLAQVQTNWKAQVALRNPHLSPTTQRPKSKGEVKKPQLIKWMGAEPGRNEKGMTYNIALNRWEGNDEDMSAFNQGPYLYNNNSSTTTLPLHSTFTGNHAHHHHTSSIPLGLNLLQPQAMQSQPQLQQYQQYPPPAFVATRRAEGSPPRRIPALISGVGTDKGLQVQNGMVLDPHVMKWLKVGHRDAKLPGGMSPSSMSAQEEEEDPFAGIDDLRDDDDDNRGDNTPTAEAGLARLSIADPDALDEPIVGEEFDVGQQFMRKQRAAEALWRKKVQGWVGDWRDDMGEGWRWGIRDLAQQWKAQDEVSAMG